jgi:hypothetical protein
MIDWAGISADEDHKESSHLGISYLFGFCFGAAHESFILPLSVILSLPAVYLVLFLC